MPSQVWGSHKVQGMVRNQCIPDKFFLEVCNSFSKTRAVKNKTKVSPFCLRVHKLVYIDKKYRCAIFQITFLFMRKNLPANTLFDIYTRMQKRN